MAGLAPWISLPDDDSQEGKMRKQLREWALSSYRTGVLQPLAMLAWRGKPLYGIPCIPSSGPAGRRPVLDIGGRGLDIKKSLGRQGFPERPFIQIGTSRPDDSEKTINFIRNFWLIGLIWIILQDLS